MVREVSPLKALEKKIAALLLSWGILEESRLQEALKDYNEEKPLPDFLRGKGLVTPRDLARARAEAEGLAFVPLDEVIPSEEALAMFPPEVAWTMEVVPVELDPGRLLKVATTRAHDVYLEDELRVHTRCPVTLAACDADDLFAALERYYGPHPDKRRSSGANRVPDSGSHHEHQKLLRSIRQSTPEVNISQMETQEFEATNLESLEIVEQKRSEMGTYDAPTENTVILNVSPMDPNSPRSILAGAINAMVEEGAEELEVAPRAGKGMMRLRLQNGWKDIGAHDGHKHKTIIGILAKTAGIERDPEGYPQEHQFLLPTPRGRYLATLHLGRTNGWERALVQVPESRPLLENPFAMVRLTDEVVSTMEERVGGKGGGLLLVTSPLERDVAWFLAAIAAWITRRGGCEVLSLERPHDRRLPDVTAINCPTASILLSSLANVSFMKPDALIVSEVENGTVLNRLFHVAQRGTTVVAGMTAPDSRTAGACIKAARVEPMNIIRSLTGHLHVLPVPTLCPKCIRNFGLEESLPSWASKDQRPQFRAADGCADCGDTGRRGTAWVATFDSPDLEKADGSFLNVVDATESARQLALAGKVDPHDVPNSP